MRQIIESDYQKLSRFFEDNDTAEIVRYFHPFPLNAESAHRITCSQSRDRFYVAVWEGQFAGFSMLRGWEEGYDIPSYGTFVGTNFRKLCIAKDLLGFTIQEAKNMGCPGVRFSTYATNWRVIRAAKIEGFYEVNRKEVEVASTQEKDIQVIMIKDL